MLFIAAFVIPYTPTFGQHSSAEILEVKRTFEGEPALRRGRHSFNMKKDDLILTLNIVSY